MREPEPFPSCEVCNSGEVASSDCPNCGSSVRTWYIKEVQRLRDLVGSLREDVKHQHNQEFDSETWTMFFGSPQGNRQRQVEKLEALNKNLKDANRKWSNEADKLQAYLKSIGSDGSIYSSVFDEAIALLDHFKIRCKETPQCNGQNS